jgi:hypothetical protein
LQFLLDFRRVLEVGKVDNCEFLELGEASEGFQTSVRDVLALVDLEDLQRILSGDQLVECFVLDVRAVAENDGVKSFAAFDVGKAVGVEAGVVSVDLFDDELVVLWWDNVVVAEKLWEAFEKDASSVSKSPFGAGSGGEGEGSW